MAASATEPASQDLSNDKAKPAEIKIYFISAVRDRPQSSNFVADVSYLESDLARMELSAYLKKYGAVSCNVNLSAIMKGGSSQLLMDPDELAVVSKRLAQYNFELGGGRKRSHPEAVMLVYNGFRFSQRILYAQFVCSAIIFRKLQIRVPLRMKTTPWMRSDLHLTHRTNQFSYTICIRSRTPML